MAVLILAMCFLPALASVRRSSKHGECLTNLMQIGYGNAIYASQDPADMALPVHPMQFSQCPEQLTPGGVCVDPLFVGAYEWGGKSGIGQTDNVFFPGSEDPTNSKYGTKAGFGPATRPLNSILYPQEFADHGGLKPGLQWVELDKLGAHLDTMLDLPLNRCPADTGYTGIHCQDFEERGLTSYDHFGTSYNANLFMVSGAPGVAQFSNSPYLHRLSDILAPSRTLAYQENNGRFAWRADPDPCSYFAGFPGTVRGWHGKDWTFNAAFLDGHADSIYMRGRDDGELGRYPDQAGSVEDWQCITVRGEGWQVDTLPLLLVETDLLHTGKGRPSDEGCIQYSSKRGERTRVSCSLGKGGDTRGNDTCGVR